MRDKGTDKRQVAGLYSFGNHSVFTAVIGKNGGQHFKKGIGTVNHYDYGHELHDHRDGEIKVFNDTKELYGYLEQKYADEIEHFNYINKAKANKQFDQTSNFHDKNERAKFLEYCRQKIEELAKIQKSKTENCDYCNEEVQVEELDDCEACTHCGRGEFELSLNLLRDYLNEDLEEEFPK